MHFGESLAEFGENVIADVHDLAGSKASRLHDNLSVVAASPWSHYALEVLQGNRLFSEDRHKLLKPDL